LARIRSESAARSSSSSADEVNSACYDKRAVNGAQISFGWYSIRNFAAGFAPSFAVLAFFRIALGVGMGAEWPEVSRPGLLCHGMVGLRRRQDWAGACDHHPSHHRLLHRPLYLTTTDLTWITVGFALQGAFAGAIYGLQPACLTERFPTAVCGTASAFCYHFGTILGGLVPPTITYLAVDRGMGFPQPAL